MTTKDQLSGSNAAVLFSIREGPAAAIREGRKRVEYRVTPPLLDAPYIAIFYVSGDTRAICLAAIVEKVVRLPAAELLDVAEPLNVPGTHNRQKLLEYLGRKALPAGLVLGSVVSLPAFGFSEIRRCDPRFRPPENFVYLRDGSTIEQRLRQSIGPLKEKVVNSSQQLSLGIES